METLFCFTPRRQVAKRLRQTGVVCVLLVALALRAEGWVVGAWRHQPYVAALVILGDLASWREI